MNHGPSSLLLRAQDLHDYKDHRLRLQEIRTSPRLAAPRPPGIKKQPYEERRKQSEIFEGNRLLHDKIKEIMERKAFTKTNGIRLFSRPDLHQNTDRVQQIKQTKFHYEVGLNQTRVLFEQRQTLYKDIMHRNSKLLGKLMNSGPAVVALEDLDSFQKQIKKVKELRQVDHAHKQCFNRD